jgi:preprotein translocase subunit SecF
MSQSTLPPVAEETKKTGSTLKDIAGRLYRGEAGLDVVGKRRPIYIVAGVIVAIAILTFIWRPFNLGIEFEGGNEFTVPASVDSMEGVRAAIEEAGGEVHTSQVLTSRGTGEQKYLIRTEELDPDPTNAATKAAEIKQELATKYRIPATEISESTVSGAWGSQITKKALYGALAFLALVVIFIASVFKEWRMAVAALAALLLNLVLTSAVYLLVGFEVTPSTIIGFLTILGFALYDVVVVFDRVRENTRGITGSTVRTYGEAANLALNQTLMRSINTSLVALLPVGGLLFIGAGLLGAGTLKDLSIVLFVGMMAAFFASIFFATPVLVELKEQEPRYKMHKQRVLARRAAGGGAERVPAKAARKGPAAAKATGTKATGTKATGAKAAQPKIQREVSDTEVPAETVAGATPRPGARPQARKRPGSKPGGTRGRSGGKRR